MSSTGSTRSCGTDQDWVPHQAPKVSQRGLPKVNPNAVPSHKLVGSLLMRTKYKYIPDNRPFVEAPPSFPIDVSVEPSSKIVMPLNPRLYDAYQTAVEETRIRKELGVDYTP